MTLLRSSMTPSLAALALCLGAVPAGAQMDDKYQPNAESKKFAEGSAIERRTRMAAIAKNPAYTRTFDLSGLPDYVPEGHPTGKLRICGNNYIGARKPIHTYGYSLRYATALEFSDRVLSASDKWNENLLGFGNYNRPNGKTYLEADQIVDHVRDDPEGIAYVRFHPKFPTDIKILDVGATDAGPFVHYSMESLQDHTYPLRGGQSFWFDRKKSEPVDPKIREFTRFILSRQGQELLEKDGKYLPLDAATVQEGLKRLH